MVENKSFFWLMRRRIVLPIIFVFLVVSAVVTARSWQTNRRMETNRQNDLKSELRSFVQLQYFALHQIEIPLNEQLQTYCETLKNGVFAKTSEIENADLNKIMLDTGIDTSKCSLHIINRNGIVVNSTVKSNLFLDFSSFGSLHVSYLNERFKNNDFGAPAFFFDSQKNRYIKYAYLPTIDGKYIIEIGAYSVLADAVYTYVAEFMNRKTAQYPHVEDINQYAMSLRPKSFNIKKQFPQEHYRYLYELQEKGEVVVADRNADGNRLHTYMYLDCIESNEIYKGIIVSVVSDLSKVSALNNWYFVQQVLSILLILVFVLLFTYYASCKIGHLIGQFVDNAQEVADGINKGQIDIQHNVMGQVREFSRLIRCFNKMSDLVSTRDSQIERQTLDIYAAKRKIIEVQELLKVQRQLAEKHQFDMEDSQGVASNIQQALLDSSSSLSGVIPESFVFAKSKEAVNGDFHWASKVDNNAIVVVADCSGHGVEASFLSVYCTVLLKTIVNVEHNVDPMSILSRLQAELRPLRCGEKKLQYCGIAMSVCCVDYDNSTLTFSGANGRIMVLGDELLRIYTGSGFPLGENDGDIPVEFDNKVVKVSGGDIVYMFTNGYAAQFNSDNTRKFNGEAFRNLLLQVSEHPLEEQVALLDETLSEWQGQTEQTDDILVLGFKISS